MSAVEQKSSAVSVRSFSRLPTLLNSRALWKLIGKHRYDFLLSSLGFPTLAVIPLITRGRAIFESGVTKTLW